MNACIEYTGQRRGRYGWRIYEGRGMGAHRAAWVEGKGAIPSGMVVMHKCDNPVCVNLDHLQLGTQRDNMQDCASKGRLKRRGASGQRNRHAKLTGEQVAEIRELHGQGHSRQQLASQFGVTGPTISKITLQRTWSAA